MRADQILDALEETSHTRGVPFELLAYAVVDGLRDLVIQETGADDAHVRLDLDNRTLDVDVYSGDNRITLGSAMTRRIAGGMKKVVEAALARALADQMAEDLRPHVGTIAYGNVQKTTDAVATLDIRLGGRRVDAVLDHPLDTPNQRVAVLITGAVEADSAQPRIVVTRRGTRFIRALLNHHIPDIRDGTVEVVSVVRRNGYRSKVLVKASVDGVDPVGSVIGAGGRTIAPVVDELHPERIDIIGDGPVERVVSSALTPAEVTDVRVVGDTAHVSVSKDQRSLALGRGGANLRLAEQLTGKSIKLVVDE